MWAGGGGGVKTKINLSSDIHVSHSINSKILRSNLFCCGANTFFRSHLKTHRFYERKIPFMELASFRSENEIYGTRIDFPTGKWDLWNSHRFPPGKWDLWNSHPKNEMYATRIDSPSAKCSHLRADGIDISTSASTFHKLTGNRIYFLTKRNSHRKSRSIFLSPNNQASNQPLNRRNDDKLTMRKPFSAAKTAERKTGAFIKNSRNHDGLIRSKSTASSSKSMIFMTF